MNWPTLTGNWHMERQISSGESATGFVTFTAQNDGSLLHHEQMVTRLPDGRMVNGERRYLLRHIDDNVLEVYFGDGPNNGKLFQRFEIAGGRAASTHICGTDTYDSTFQMQRDDSFVITHKVSGTNKDYTIHTVYTQIIL